MITSLKAGSDKAGKTTQAAQQLGERQSRQDDTGSTRAGGDKGSKTMQQHKGQGDKAGKTKWAAQGPGGQSRQEDTHIARRRRSTRVQALTSHVRLAVTNEAGGRGCELSHRTMAGGDEPSGRTQARTLTSQEGGVMKRAG
ncbi:hypothetical protein FA15DRAFT_710956 [Coprinopsis marcescibilis]|uniref:Uncharacterized protein n=1 Tax=Coprinopsis marcescibilis TaxID=230819 RepID=A0A5C3KB19_COPMA|nr:hypothetical protein FA15DRAFT_710956 [Coprinopsis marcescibilis]